MGYAVGLACIRDPAAAAAAYCAGVGGSSSGGLLSCSAPSITGQELTFTLAVDGASSQVTRQVVMQLGECEPLDMESAGPFLWMAVACVVVVGSLKLLRRQVFAE